MSNDKKIVLFPKTAKVVEKEETNTIDINNPIGTVYGVQQWINGNLIGTSLYSSQVKANFVLQTLRRENEEGKILGVEYKAINYPVY